MGAIGTALHYLVLIVLVSGLGNDPATSAMIGATSGAVCNYWLNYRYTFQCSTPHLEVFTRFIGMAILGILLNGILVWTWTRLHINYLISQVFATLIVLGINFVISKFWVFKK
jgi:putative flippase GtrA